MNIAKDLIERKISTECFYIKEKGGFADYTNFCLENNL